jgi:hypothetical protein
MTAHVGKDLAQSGVAQPVEEVGSPERIISALVGAAVVLFLASITLFGVAMALGPPAVTGGPMLSLSARFSPSTVVMLQGAGLLFGALAVAIGVAAVGRGWRPSITLLVGAGAAVVALFVFLPPIWGDTDVLNYAVYGRIAALGHSPYVMTPADLYRTGDPVGLLAPPAWRMWPTVYGPAATALQWAAATLGGASMAQIVFWIKLGNGIAYVATAVGLVRLAGPDRARQARACLLWTVNPLMLFWLVGGGHVDVWLALLAVLAMIVYQKRHGSGIIAGAVTGLIIGAGAAIKTPFVLVGLGIAWDARKSPRIIAAGLFGAALLIPSYLLPGALDGGVLARRLTWNPGFLPLPGAISSRPDAYGAVLLLGMLLLALLLLWRMPPGYRELPAVRPAVALVLAYIVLFPTAGPWYDALIFPLLALMPSGWLDYLVIAQCLLLSEMAFPGLPNKGAYEIERLVGILSHLGVLLVPVALVVMCLRRAWGSVSNSDSGEVAAMATSYTGTPRRGRHRARSPGGSTEEHSQRFPPVSQPDGPHGSGP